MFTTLNANWGGAFLLTVLGSRRNNTRVSMNEISKCFGHLKVHFVKHPCVCKQGPLRQISYCCLDELLESHLDTLPVDHLVMISCVTPAYGHWPQLGVGKVGVHYWRPHGVILQCGTLTYIKKAKKKPGLVLMLVLLWLAFTLSKVGFRSLRTCLLCLFCRYLRDDCCWVGVVQKKKAITVAAVEKALIIAAVWCKMTCFLNYCHGNWNIICVSIHEKPSLADCSLFLSLSH